MKKDESDELRPEYRREDLGEGVRGKYLEAYRAGTNLVLLSPEVAKVFPTEESVNEPYCPSKRLAKIKTYSFDLLHKVPKYFPAWKRRLCAFLSF